MATTKVLIRAIRSFCCGALGRDWHFTSVRCDATIWSLFEVKRTCRARRDCVDPTRMTHSRHKSGRDPAVQQPCSICASGYVLPATGPSRPVSISSEAARLFLELAKKGSP